MLVFNNKGFTQYPYYGFSPIGIYLLRVGLCKVIYSKTVHKGNLEVNRICKT
jgi:hypothetical protein